MVKTDTVWQCPFGEVDSVAGHSLNNTINRSVEVQSFSLEARKQEKCSMYRLLVFVTVATADSLSKVVHSQFLFP